MTVQVSEILKIGDIRYRFDNEPLKNYLKDKRYDFDDPRCRGCCKREFGEDDDGFSIFNSTACHRGYIGEWELKNNELYLVGFESVINYRGADGNIYGKEVDLSYLFPGASFVKASWFTGSIFIPTGTIIGYHHGCSYSPVYSEEIVYEIEQGNVVKTSKKQYRQEDIIPETPPEDLPF